jgi:hypothetical protein
MKRLLSFEIRGQRSLRLEFAGHFAHDRRLFVEYTKLGSQAVPKYAYDKDP